MSRGILIDFEGIDGSGKTTAVHHVAEHLVRAGFSVLLLREPTRGRYGAEIRRLSEMNAPTTLAEELDLFIRDRREDVELNIEPGLSAGKVVIMDRYVLSTIAYQGAKGAKITDLVAMNAFAPVPNIVFLLDVSVDVAMERIAKGRKTTPTSFEREDYLQQVRQVYLREYEAGGEYGYLINAEKSVQRVFEQCNGILLRFLGNNG